MKKFFNNKKGFTAIEVLVALLLSGIIITVIYQVISVSSKTSNVANEQMVSANAVDRTMETIRQMAMSATEVEICDITSLVQEEGDDVVWCMDNTIYYNDKKLSDAKEIGAASIELEFEPGGSEDNILKVRLVAKDKNGAMLNGKCRDLKLYLHSIGGDGKGEIKENEDGGKNCIIFSTLAPLEE